jgi:hypothetical protein
MLVVREVITVRDCQKGIAPFLMAGRSGRFVVARHCAVCPESHRLLTGGSPVPVRDRPP